MRIPIDKIRPNPWNVNLLTEEEFSRLKELMRASGPGRTPPVAVREREGGYYEIIDGEQRWRAAKELGWRDMPAMIIEASDLEAKKYTLSFNYLKGRINYVKMLKLMAEDEELVRAAREVFSRSEWAALEKFLKLYREGRIAPHVLGIIESEVRKGTRIDPRILEILDVPDVHQKTAVGMMLTAYNPKDLREILLRQHQPAVEEERKAEFSLVGGGGREEPAKEEGAAEKEEFSLEGAGKIEEGAVEKEERAVGQAKLGAEEDIEKRVKSIIAPAEAVVSFICEKCGAEHVIYYHREHKAIEACRIEDVKKGAVERFRADSTKVSFMPFACPRCGKRLGVDFEDRTVVEFGEDRED